MGAANTLDQGIRTPATQTQTKGSKFIIYQGGPGITDTHKGRVNQDLLAFLEE